MARQKTPEQIAAARSKSAKRAAKTRAYNGVVNEANDKREKFEANNPERMQRIQDDPKMVGSKPATQISVKHAYRAMNIGVQHEADQNVPGQQALPGFEHHPAEVATPPRWEDMPAKAQTRVLKNAAKFGVTPESAHHAMGAQVDQAALREQSMMSGRHASFYAAHGTDENGIMTPRTRLATSAKENGVPFEHQAIANSITSPKMKFVETPKSGPYKGQTVYRNDTVATAAIHQEAQGKAIEDIRTPKGMPGFHSATQRAAAAVRNMKGGATAAEAWNAGPKTGPYHNSWVDPHGPSQFWVSDIHSGGGAIAPHLDQPQREAYLNIQGIHSFNDHVARNVAAERGIPSLTGMQSMQWSEERRQRGLEDDHQKPKANLSPAQFKGQQTLPGM